MQGKLILVEGLCGTGKSTLAGRLYRHIAAQGIPARFYDEGAEGHPASLNGHAFFRQKEFAGLLGRFPDHASELRSRAVTHGPYVLVPYRQFRNIGALYGELKSRELCWTDAAPAAFWEFTDVMRRHWGRFAEAVAVSGDVYVLEAVFFQHQIHDLLKHYRADDGQIREHILGMAERIAPLRPVLIYLSHPSVREQQIWISSVRSKPHLASEENVKFMENRKRIELTLLKDLPFPHRIIENASWDWENVFRRALETIGPT